MALDLASSQLKHSSWTPKSRDFLDGKATLSAAQATDHKRCELGKTLCAAALIEHSSIPEMRKLEREHETLRELIKTIINSKQAGRVKEAESQCAAADGVSNQISDLLPRSKPRSIASRPDRDP